ILDDPAVTSGRLARLIDWPALGSATGGNLVFFGTERSGFLMHNRLRRIVQRAFAALAVLCIAAPAPGNQIRITVTNNQPSGGFALAPVWFGVQNGTFNTFTPGSTASSQIATLAQFGNTTPLANLFNGQGDQTTLKSAGSLPQFLPG